MTEKQRLDTFVADLKALLKKYDAHLGLHIEGDTHGIYNEGLDVQFLEPLQDGQHFRTFSKVVVIGRGYSFNAKEICAETI